MEVSIYVDGAGGEKSGYGFFVKETGESFYENKSGLTNNQAEYHAIIAALKKFQGSSDKITIFSDSKNTVNQLNHEFAINNEQLRALAQEAWLLIPKIISFLISGFVFLYSRNERLVCHFKSDQIYFSVILVGAINVSSIETTWKGEISPPMPKKIIATKYGNKNLKETSRLNPLSTYAKTKYECEKLIKNSLDKSKLDKIYSSSIDETKLALKKKSS